MSTPTPMSALVARLREQRTTERPSVEQLDVPAEQVAAKARALRLKQGALAEQRHQFRDLDPDSVCRLPGCTCPAVPPREGSTT